MHKPLFAAAIVLATTTAAQATERLEPVVVSDDRSAEVDTDTPVSIQVIDRAEIELSGATTLAELLTGRPGIHVSDLFGDGSNASIDMRGFGPNSASNVLVMVDGHRLNSSSDKASLYLNSIDLDIVDHVEIIQGSAGILYGNQAVGGAINIITRKPGAPLYKIGGGVGSYDTGEARALASARGENGIGYRLQLSKRQSDNYRDHNDSDLTNANLLVDYRLPQGRVYVEFEHYDEFTDTPGALFADELAADRRQSAAVYGNDYLDTRSNLLRIGLDHQLSAAWRFEGDISYREEHRNFVQSFRTFPANPNAPSTQDRDVLTLNPRLIGQLGDTTVTVGADWESTDYNLLTAFGPQIDDQDIRAIYGQAVVPLADRLSGTVGVRHSQVKNHIYYTDFSVSPPVDRWTNLDDDVTVGSAGLVFRPAAPWRVFARAEQNFRYAKVDEHTNPVFGQPVGLNNQTGITYEAGTEYQQYGIQASVLAYRIDLEDEISFDASGYANINLDQTRRQGLGLSLSAPLGDTLLAGISYDFVDSEITDGPFQGNRIPLVPEQQARLFGEWAVTGRSSLFAEAIYVGDQVLGGDFSNAFDTLDSYTVVNLNARYERGGWVLDARINNLFDKAYSESASLGTDASFATRPAFFPAPERNLWLSASYRL